MGRVIKRFHPDRFLHRAAKYSFEVRAERRDTLARPTCSASFLGLGALAGVTEAAPIQRDKYAQRQSHDSSLQRARDRQLRAERHGGKLSARRGDLRQLLAAFQLRAGIVFRDCNMQGLIGLQQWLSARRPIRQACPRRSALLRSSLTRSACWRAIPPSRYERREKKRCVALRLPSGAYGIAMREPPLAMARPDQHHVGSALPLPEAGPYQER